MACRRLGRFWRLGSRPLQSSAAGLRPLRRSGTQMSGTRRFPGISHSVRIWCQARRSPVRSSPRLLQSLKAPILGRFVPQLLRSSVHAALALSGAKPLRCFWFRLDPSIASALGAPGALPSSSVLGRSGPCPFRCSLLFLVRPIRAKHSATSGFGTRLIWRVVTNVALGSFGAQPLWYPALRWSGILILRALKIARLWRSLDHSAAWSIKRMAGTNPAASPVLDLS